MLAPVQASSGASLWVMEVTRTAPPNPLVKKIPNTTGHGFATISPDDANVVAAWGGKMWMLDRATGANKGALMLGNKMMATHPDWSPDGSQLVFATGAGDAPSGAGLATIPWAGDKWGTPTVIVPSTGTTNLFPMHSPDGKWIAFSRGRGGHGDATAQLMVVPSTGGTPIELTNANKWVSNALGDGLTENNQPTWAPPGDYNWVAFNSQREYGVVLPKGTQQIWVAAIDLAKAARGEDPSYPAFRLQFQGLQEDNHRAFWTLDVRDQVPMADAGVAEPDAAPPAPDAGVAPEPDAAPPPMCVASEATCDPTLDTCCNSQQRCDTHDDGLTYRCYFPLIQ